MVSFTERLHCSLMLQLWVKGYFKHACSKQHHQSSQLSQQVAVGLIKTTSKMYPQLFVSVTSLLWNNSKLLKKNKVCTCHHTPKLPKATLPGHASTANCILHKVTVHNAALEGGANQPTCIAPMSVARTSCFASELILSTHIHSLYTYTVYTHTQFIHIHSLYIHTQFIHIHTQFIHTYTVYTVDKAYMLETSCSQLLLIKFATDMLIKINSLLINNVQIDSLKDG